MRTCTIDHSLIACDSVGVNLHSFGRPLSSSWAIPYRIAVSFDEVIELFDSYYQDFVDRESEDLGFEEVLTGNYLLLKQTGYLSLEAMILSKSDLLRNVLFELLPSEFMGFMFGSAGAVGSKKYVLQTLRSLDLRNGMAEMEGFAFVNPLFSSNDEPE
jgi:hypothetical protein